MIADVALTFLLGFCYDVVLIYWNHSTVIGRRPVFSALLSTLLGAAGLVGVLAAIHSVWAACGLVAGYGVGTFFATKWLPK